MYIKVTDNNNSDYVAVEVGLNPRLLNLRGNSRRDTS